MPAIIPDWQVGRHLTVYTLTKQAFNPDTGALTDNGTALDVRAVMEEFGHDRDIETEEIRPIWSTQHNEVYIGSGHRGRLTTLSRGYSASVLAELAMEEPEGYVKVSWTEGVETFTGYFKIGNYTGGMRGHGRQTKTLELLPCDVTDPQLVHTVAP